MEFSFSLDETFPLPSPPSSPSSKAAVQRPPSSVLLKSPFAVDLGPHHESSEIRGQNENANNPCGGKSRDHVDGAGARDDGVHDEEDGSPAHPTAAEGPALSPISILKIGHDLMPIGGPIFSGPKSTQTLQYRVSEILDTIGLASAKAQGLRQPITSGMKLRMQTEHWVYLLIDRAPSAPPAAQQGATKKAAGGNNGAVLGMLKVGRKNLFLLDERGQQREMSPLCVLDFYVHEQHQRAGLGKQLFEHMMRDLSVTHPRYLAVDKPSQKLVGFLRKHYGLGPAHIPQTNNYTVYQGFFQDRPTDGMEAGGPRKMRIYMGKLQYI